jgi:hypothetical protein
MGVLERIHRNACALEDIAQAPQPAVVPAVKSPAVKLNNGARRATTNRSR